MSTYIGLGQSHADDPAEAGEEAVAKALKDFPEATPDVIFLYATFGYDFGALLQSVRARSHGATVVGGTTLGIITATGPETEFHRVSVCAIKSDEFHMYPLLSRGLLGRTAAAGEEIGTAIAKLGKQDIRGLYLFADGLRVADPDALLAAIEAKIPAGVPVFGGTASEPFLWKNTYQFYNDEVLEDSTVGILFTGKLNIAVVSSHGSEELGAVHEVTRAEGARIYEIDNKPAMHLFTELYGVEQKEVSATTAVGVCLGVRPQTIEEGGEAVELRVPLSSEKDGSIIMAAAWPVGTKIYICQRDAARIIERAGTVARDLVAKHGGAKPLLVFHADCVGRSADQVGRDVSVAEVRATIDAFPKGTPWFGAYVYGELAPVGGHPAFHNWTGAIASLYLE